METFIEEEILDVLFYQSKLDKQLYVASQQGFIPTEEAFIQHTREL